jgi:hypothetical protein
MPRDTRRALKCRTQLRFALQTSGRRTPHQRRRSCEPRAAATPPSLAGAS